MARNSLILSSSVTPKKGITESKIFRKMVFNEECGTYRKICIQYSYTFVDSGRVMTNLAIWVTYVINSYLTHAPLSDLYRIFQKLAQKRVVPP